MFHLQSETGGVEDTGDAEKNCQNRELFRGMKIMNAGEAYKRQMGMYPVFWLNLITKFYDLIFPLFHGIFIFH